MQPEILASWPGPVTWVVPAKPGLPRFVTGTHQGIAVRVSAHPVVRQLCAMVGVLVSTSANPGGHIPARNPLKVRNYFADRVDYIVPGQLGSSLKPTEIRNALNGKILRKGR
jgi:L-threonylcarbamoyladenylate synthase